MASKRRLLVVVVHRCYLDDRGAWTTELYNSTMWQECLNSWDEVVVTGPSIHMNPPTEATRVDGKQIRFLPLPNSVGYWGALAAIPKRFFYLRKIVAEHDAVVLHAPSDIGAIACIWARYYGIPYGIDVRGDQSVNSAYLKERGTPFASLSAYIFRILFSWVRQKSLAAIYVSNELKTRFPLTNNHQQLVFSDVRIPRSWFLRHRDYSQKCPPWKICTVGRLESQKGYEYLLRACAEVVKLKPGLLKLEIIGSGPLQNELHQLVNELNLNNIVSFRGFVPWGAALFQILSDSDLFILSSVTEGMPRSLLEAMACSLPIIATSVGGIPEVVPIGDLVAPKDIAELRDKLIEVLSNPDRMTEMSVTSAERAKDFRPERLIAGKQQFYQLLRNEADIYPKKQKVLTTV